MSDLMERLRSEAVNWSASCGHLFDEAADRIEALEAALHKIDDITIDHTAMGIARKALARAALAPEQDK
jgi:hypothetical protein